MLINVYLLNNVTIKMFAFEDLIKQNGLLSVGLC